MTKRLIEVDDEKLEAVRGLLGTRTVKATVDEAFDEVFALAQRRRALLEARGADATALGIGAGSEVACDTIVIRKAEGGSSRGQRMVDRLRGRGDVTMTTDEIMALTRGG